MASSTIQNVSSCPDYINAFIKHNYDKLMEIYGEGYEDIPTRVPDIGEAKKYLNWEPKVNLSNSITMTLQSFIYEK